MQDIFTDANIPPIDFDAEDVVQLVHAGVEEVMSPAGDIRSTENCSDDEMSDVASSCPSLKTYHSGSDYD